MSEFTDAILFLKKNADAVTEQAKTLPWRYLLREINEKWSALFVERLITGKPLDAWLLVTSAKVPLLFFENGEDHGWDYTVFENGKQTAHVSVSYETDFKMMLDLIKARYPQVDDPWHWLDKNGEETRRLFEEVRSSVDYRTALIEQYKDRNIRALRVFEISEETLQKLETNLTVDYYGHDQVETFKNLMGFPEVSWMSYRYLSKETDEEENEDDN